MTDFAARRLVMVESQLRPNQVTDRRLLAAMGALPRERFVPPRLRGVAYSDETIEIFPAVDGAPARFLLAPMVFARLTQLAAIGPDDSVLDVGCATGYSTAALAALGRSVVGIEPEPELAEAARGALLALGIANAEIVEGPLERGHQAGAPYDVILVNGSLPEPPETLLSQLNEGGRLVTVLSSGVNSGAQGKAYCFIKVGGEASGRPRFDAGAEPLPGFSPALAFTF
jgi:protein-L-isoaspartate(D-aspartate) O-methyltransferase